MGFYARVLSGMGKIYVRLWGFMNDLTPSILRRMTTRIAPDPEVVPLTSSRAVRLAMSRAADEAHDMAVSVLGMREEILPLDELNRAIEPELLLIGLKRDDELVGLAALDFQLRAATLEAQSVGRVLAFSPEERPATKTDAFLVTPLVAMFLKMLDETTDNTDLDGWTEGAKAGHRVESVRVAALSLPDREYRLVRLTLDLGAGDRQGEIAVILPAARRPVPEAVLPKDHANWDAAFRRAVMDAPATLDAILHKFRMSIQAAEGLAPGLVIPLPGCTVDSVKLIDPRGGVAGKARLGQFAGMRAVRIDDKFTPQMNEIAAMPKGSRMAAPMALGVGDTLDAAPSFGTPAFAALDDDGDLPPLPPTGDAMMPLPPMGGDLPTPPPIMPEPMSGFGTMGGDAPEEEFQLPPMSTNFPTE